MSENAEKLLEDLISALHHQAKSVSELAQQVQAQTELIAAMVIQEEEEDEGALAYLDGTPIN